MQASTLNVVFHLNEKSRSPPFFRHGKGKIPKFLSSSRMQTFSSFLFFFSFFFLSQLKFSGYTTSSFLSFFLFFLLLFRRIYLTGVFLPFPFFFFCGSSHLFSFFFFFRICFFLLCPLSMPMFDTLRAECVRGCDGDMTVRKTRLCRRPHLNVVFHLTEKSPSPPFFRHGRG